MPHTSHRRKKPSISKRVEVTDDDGWTRVTSTDRNRQFPKPNNPSNTASPAETGRAIPEEGTTVQSLLDEYAKIEKRWEQSEACKALSSLLKDQVLHDGRQIDKCIIFGSASFCGLRRGWISMKVPAMSQLAAFKSMHRTIEQLTGQSIPVYAQDPAYNEIDVELLKLLGVEIVEDPHGFALLTSKSLAYTPTAELHVELRTLYAKPSIRLGSKLDFYWRNEKGMACTTRVLLPGEDTPGRRDGTGTLENASDQTSTASTATGRFKSIEDECKCFEDFLRDRQEASVPQFDLKDVSPFRDQHLYWLRSVEDE